MSNVPRGTSAIALVTGMMMLVGPNNGDGTSFSAQVAAEPNHVDFSGCLAMHGEAYLVSDDKTHKVYEMRGANARQDVGMRVKIQAAEVMHGEHKMVPDSEQVVSVRRYAVIGGCSSFVCDESKWCILKREDCVATRGTKEIWLTRLPPPPADVDCSCAKCQPYGRLLPKP